MFDFLITVVRESVNEYTDQDGYAQVDWLYQDYNGCLGGERELKAENSRDCAWNSPGNDSGFIHGSGAGL